ncbi:CD99 antigen-like protein 2 isoform X11 [Pan troglodytes]|uniref:CD99 antigen-like protein 2 isoform X11 n=1 Tax=Pan troglodytes TaxID=9598 RepID=UPI0007DC778E|nr:CD99 antigen-like protein 2 isoform X6 [Pan troglodytes]|eukprot:XP_016885380.1 CD99 antigen-like protein 2 isoform X2 [Homo sapiens]
MVAWRSAFLVCLAFSLATLVQRGSGDFDDFNLEDAVKETSSVKQRWNHVTTTTKRPVTTRAPANTLGNDFDLADALDDRNDRDDGRRKPIAGGGGFSDKDLEDIVGGGEYKPDKGKGDGRYGSNDDPGSGMVAEPGTIAGVASALAMALIGAVSSYISYQQKKFCFSIQHAAAGQGNAALPSSLSFCFSLDASSFAPCSGASLPLFSLLLPWHSPTWL